VVQAALSAARGGSHTPKFLTEHEKKFYKNLLEIMQENRKEIFGMDENKIKKEDETATDNESSNIILRILKDVPSFIGDDMKKYSLRKEDVISMPKETAEVLTKRGAAEEIVPTVDA